MACNALLTASALAAPAVSLQATLEPDLARHTTSVRLQMNIAPEPGELVPPPLTYARLRYPASLDVQLSELGIDACSQETLALRGPTGCPPDSQMGYGDATAEVAIEGQPVHESAHITIVRGAEHEGHLTMLLVVYREPALSAQIILPTMVLPAAKPFGGRLTIGVPLVSAIPEGPDLSVSQIQLVLGPKHLKYTERVHGRITHYEPAGIPLPEKCPRGGFRFTLQMEFLDGSHAQASTTAPCTLKDQARRRRRLSAV